MKIKWLLKTLLIVWLLASLSTGSATRCTQDCVPAKESFQTPQPATQTMHFAPFDFIKW